MNQTTVDSNKKNKKDMPTVAGSTIQVTENTLEVPPRGQVYEVITGYIEEQGNMEIPAGDAIVNENGQMQLEDGKKQREEKSKKVKASSKAETER